MKKVIHTFSERMANPSLQLIDFSLFVTDQYLCKRKVTEAFWFNDNFRREVKNKLNMDPLFKKKFEKYLPELYQEISNIEEKKENHLSK